MDKVSKFAIVCEVILGLLAEFWMLPFAFAFVVWMLIAFSADEKACKERGGVYRSTTCFSPEALR